MLLTPVQWFSGFRAREREGGVGGREPVQVPFIEEFKPVAPSSSPLELGQRLATCSWPVVRD